MGETSERVGFLTSQRLVTISLPVDVYVLNTMSSSGVLVIVSFDTSPGTLSSFLKLVSLSLSMIYVFSSTLSFKFAIRVCSNLLNLHVSF